MRWPWISRATHERKMMEQARVSMLYEQQQWKPTEAALRAEIAELRWTLANARISATALATRAAEAEALLMAERHGKGLPAKSTGEYAVVVDPSGR